MNLSANTKRWVMLAFWLIAVTLGIAITRNPAVVLTIAAGSALFVVAAVFKPAQLVTLAAVMIPFRVLEVFIPISRGGITIADGFLLAFVIAAFSRPKVVEGRKIAGLLVVLFVLVVAIGFVSSVNAGYYAVGARKVGRIAVVGLMFVAASRSLVFRDAKRAASAFVLACGLSSIVALGFTFRAATVPGIGVVRLWGGVEDPNHMAVVLSIGFLVAVAWRPRDMPPWLWMTAIVLGLVGQVASLSRGAGAALAVGVGALVLLTVRARFGGRQMELWSRSGAVLVTLAAVAGIGATLIPESLIAGAVVRYEGLLNPATDATGAFRIRLWQTGLRMLAGSPLLGVGPGAFGLALVASGAYTVPWEAHSSFIEIGVEMGYLGAGAVILVVIAGGVTALRTFSGAVHDPEVDVEQIALATALLAGAAALIMAGASLSNILYQPLFATVVILLVATMSRQVDA